VEQLGLGIAIACTAALLYVPFSQRTLLRMGQSWGSGDDIVRVDGADGRRRTSGRATRRKMAHVFAGIAWAGAASGAPTKATANAKTQCYIGPVVNSGPYDGPLKILPYARFLL